MAQGSLPYHYVGIYFDECVSEPNNCIQEVRERQGEWHILDAPRLDNSLLQKNGSRMMMKQEK